MTMAMSVVLRMVCGVTLALASARPAGAADAPAAATRHSAGLTVSGAGPYFTLHLPMAIQSQASTVDLSDLQVHNARGDALPFAWVAARPPASEQHRQAAPFPRRLVQLLRERQIVHRVDRMKQV